MKLFLVLMAAWLFAMPTPAQSLEPTRAERAARKEFMAQLRQKFFPLVEFKDATLAECVGWLKKQGVAVEIAPELETNPAAKLGASDAAQRPEQLVTLTVRGVPASEVIKYVANLTITNYEVKNGKLQFVPIGSATQCSYLESWGGIPLAFFEGRAAKIAANRERAVTVQKPSELQAFFEKKGIPFQDWEWALYSTEEQQLVVKFGMEEKIERIDDLIADFEKKHGKGK